MGSRSLSVLHNAGRDAWAICLAMGLILGFLWTPPSGLHVRRGAFEQKIGAGNQADDAVCHDIRAQVAVEFPVPKPTGCARPKSQGSEPGNDLEKAHATSGFQDR